MKRFLFILVLLSVIAGSTSAQDATIEHKYDLIATIDHRATSLQLPNNLIVSPTMKYMLAFLGGKKSSMLIYEMATGKPIKTISIEKKVSSIHYCFANEETVYFRYRKRVAKLDIATGQVTYGRLRDFENTEGKLDFQFDNMSYFFEDGQITGTYLQGVWMIKTIDGISYLYYNLNL